MGFFGTIDGHTDEGDDEAGLTCMISNSRMLGDNRTPVVEYSVTPVNNPEDVVIDQGAEPLSGTLTIYTSYMVCALVCTYVPIAMSNQSSHTKY